MNNANGMPNRPPSMNNNQKPDPKKNGRKPTPNGEKKPNQPKSPAVKRTKEITYVKLFAVQQQFKAEPKVMEPLDDDLDIVVPEVQIEEDAEAEAEKPAEEEKPEEKEEEPEEKEAEASDVEARSDVVEDHEQYEQSEHEEQTEEVCFYDPNDVREIDVNSKNKATSLKKIILESIGLFKRANIVLLKS